MIKALKNTILVTEFKYGERKVGSIIIRDDNGTTRGIRPRWGKIIATGDDVNEVNVGQWVLVEHGRWSHGVDVDTETGKVTVFKVDPTGIMLVTDSEPNDEFINND